MQLVEVFELSETVLVDGSDRLGKVSVHVRILQVEFPVVVVNDPGEDGVLREVVVGAVAKDVDVVEVLDVGKLSVGPHVHNV